MANSDKFKAHSIKNICLHHRGQGRPKRNRKEKKKRENPTILYLPESLQLLHRRFPRPPWRNRESSGVPSTPWMATGRGKWAAQPHQRGKSWGTRPRPAPEHSMRGRHRPTCWWTWWWSVLVPTASLWHSFSLYWFWGHVTRHSPLHTLTPTLIQSQHTCKSVRVVPYHIKVMIKVLRHRFGVRKRSNTPYDLCCVGFSSFPDMYWSTSNFLYLGNEK